MFLWFPCAAFARRLFGGIRWRHCGSANIEETGSNLVRPGSPSKWTEHVPLCLITFKLFRRQAAIHHRIRRSRSDIPTAQYLFEVSWRNGKKNLTFASSRYFSNVFLFLICAVKSKTMMIRHWKNKGQNLMFNSPLWYQGFKSQIKTTSPIFDVCLALISISFGKIFRYSLIKRNF